MISGAADAATDAGAGTAGVADVAGDGESRPWK